MQFIWPVNTEKIRFITYIYIFLQQSLSRYCLLYHKKCHICQISNVQKVRHIEQPAYRWRTEQSRRVIQCKLYEQKIDIFKVWLSFIQQHLTSAQIDMSFTFEWSKIEKVPRGIRGEKSSKDMASSRNLVSTIGALASPKMGDGTRCPEG